MDKETLSNYGWIVICVLVLAVMIALATPFGDFIANSVKSTTQGLFDTNQKALNATGLINIPDQKFDDEQSGIIPTGGIYTTFDGTVFTEGDEFIRVSLRSKDDFSVNRLSRGYFNGGGHERAAGGRLFMPVGEVEEYFVKSLGEFIEKEKQAHLL